MPFSKKLFLGFCICFYLTAAVPAQYRIDQWTADDRLPQNSVYGIVQTRDGYLWAATLDGLARFDGVRFTVFNKGNTTGIVNKRFISLFQECLNNILKHSEAREVKVTIAESELGVSIEISDDGKGFDLKEQSRSNRTNGFGLIGMTERIRLLGGTFAVESEIGEGTVISIEIWKRE